MQRSRLLAVLLATSIVITGLSCRSGDVPTAPQAASSAELARPAANPLGGTPVAGGELTPKLLSCTPQPYARSSMTIGPRGGTITVGKHSLVVPAGALTRDVPIIAEAPSDSVVSVRLMPEGLRFAPGKPAMLTLDYSACPLDGRNDLKQVVHTTETLVIVELLLSVDNPIKRKVSAPLRHFSRYAVAY
jgi:hypothetical protein